MLAEIFKNVIIMSLFGGLLCMILLILSPVTRKFLTPNQNYYIYAAVIFLMLFPVYRGICKVAPNISATPAINTVIKELSPDSLKDFAISAKYENSKAVKSASTSKSAADEASAIKNAAPDANSSNSSALSKTENSARPDSAVSEPKTSDKSAANLLGIIWIIGAIAALTLKALRYSLFLRNLHKSSVLISLDRGKFPEIPKNLKIRTSDNLDSPLLIGFFKPVLFLPAEEIPDADLKYILLHELTHYRRRDPIFKLAASIASAVHWFNPFAYAAARKIDAECEISCDASATALLSQNEKRDYMNMILNMAQLSKLRTAPSAVHFFSGKRIIKKRFEAIQSSKSRKITAIIIGVFAAALIFAFIWFGSGIFSNNSVQNETAKQNIVVTADDIVLSLNKKPFVKNNEIYVPLSETLKLLGESNTVDENSEQIDSGDGRIGITVYEENTYKYVIQIGKNQIHTSSINDVWKGASTDMENSPIIKNSEVFVPISYIDLMVQEKNISGTFFDKNGKTIATSERKVPFDKDEIESAKAVVEEYFRASNAKDRAAILKTVTPYQRRDNVVFASDDESTISVKNISFDPFDSARREYVTHGRGTVTKTALENVIVFRVDYRVDFPDGKLHGAYSNNDYDNWKMILVRDKKGGEWLIDDQGY